MAQPTGRRASLRLEFLEDRLAPAGLADPPLPPPAAATTGVARPAGDTSPASAANAPRPGMANSASTSAGDAADTGTDPTREATEYPAGASNGSQPSPAVPANAMTTAPASQTEPSNEYSPSYVYRPPPSGTPFFVPAASATAAWYPSYDPPAPRPERVTMTLPPVPVVEPDGRDSPPTSGTGAGSPGEHPVVHVPEQPEPIVPLNGAPAPPPDAPAPQGPAAGPGPGQAPQQPADANDRAAEQQAGAEQAAASLAPESARFLAEVLPADFGALEAGLTHLLTRLETVANGDGTSVRISDLAPWVVGVSGVVAAVGLARRRRRGGPALARLAAGSANGPSGGAGA